MTRTIRTLLAAVALALATRPLCAQRIPFDWRNRTLVGGSLDLLTVERGNAIPMLALHVTPVGAEAFATNVTLGLALVQGILGGTADLGLGVAVPIEDAGLLVLGAGPSVIAAAGGNGFAALAGVHASAGVVMRLSDNLGVRFDAGRRWYLAGGGAASLWAFGFGVTGLGAPRAAGVLP